MHWLNILIISGLVAGVGLAIVHVRRDRAADREKLARMKRFNMSSDELHGTRSLLCPDCGLLLSAGGHKHTCPNAPVDLTPSEQAELNTLLSAKRE